MNDYSINVEICRQLGAKIIGEWQDLKFQGVNFHSKLIQRNMLFVGLEGEKYNGSDFAREAWQNGATGLILNYKIDLAVPQIIVNNVWSFIYRYSVMMRNLYKNKLIAICGSSGKTTLKHIASQVLPGKLLFTKRSFNLKLSICCTLLFLNNDIDYVIIECGHNVPGEMDDFGRLLKPDYVIYSKIDEEHMAFFKTIEVIKHEQAQILYYTSCAVVCDKDYGEYLRNNSYVSENLSIVTEDVCKIEDTNIIYKGVSYNLGHNYFTYGVKQSIAKVILLCEILNIKLSEDKFQNLSVPNMRGNIIKLPNHHIYDLSFNLNIGSLKNVIESIEHNKETVDFIYGYMAEARNGGNEEALEMLADCSYINRVYTYNIIYDHEKCEVFNYEEHKDKLLNIIYIHGSKVNHMIGIVGKLIDYYTGQKELSPMLKHL